MRRHAIAGVAVLALMLTLWGCGSPDDAAVDTSKPLEGRELTRADQLEGTWLGITEGDYIGFEFMSDGQVLATPFAAAIAGLNSGVMLRYSVLEGGRLSLVAPDGRSQTYTVEIAGEQLELIGTMLLSETDTQRFRRLPRGQTLEQGIAEQEAAEARAYQERLSALNAFLAEPGLVMATAAPAPRAPAAVALELDPGGTGRAWHDDTPPHLDRITAAVVPNDRGNMPQVNVTFGPQMEPPPIQQRPGGTITFAVSGSVQNPSLTAQVNYGGQQFELTITRDPDRHEQIVGRLDAELARIDALRAPLVAALEDFAVLEGPSASEYPNRPQPNIARIVLIRDPASGAYTGESTLIDGTTGQAAPMPQTTALITVLEDRAMLMINAYNRQYQLTLDAATGKLTGGWFYQGNQNGQAAELTILEAVDAAARERQVVAERTALGSLNAAEPLLGLVNTRAQFLPQPTPVSLALTSSNGQIAGTATFPIVPAVIDVQGQIVETIAGPRLQLRFTNLREAGHSHGQNLFGTLRNQTWSYAVADAGSPVKLTDGALELTQATEAYGRELRQQLSAALGDGLRMTIDYPDYKDNVAQLTFEFRVDGGGRITGGAVAGTRRNLFNERSTVEGELKEISGLPLLSVQIADPPPARPNDFRRIEAVELVGYPAERGWRFTAPTWPTHAVAARNYVGFVQAID